MTEKSNGGKITAQRYGKAHYSHIGNRGAEVKFLKATNAYRETLQERFEEIQPMKRALFEYRFGLNEEIPHTIDQTREKFWFNSKKSVGELIRKELKRLGLK